MKAIVLAAGYATRLYPLTLDRPKCLLPVAGKPMLDWLCQKLFVLKGLEDIIIVTNAKFYEKLLGWQKSAIYDKPIRVLNDGTFSNETRLGAIGDLKFSLDQEQAHTDVLMVASDNLFQTELHDFIRFAQGNDGVSLALYDIQDAKLATKKYGVVEIDPKGQVVRIEEKPEYPASSLIGTGVYYFPKKTLLWVSEYLAQAEAKDAPGYYIHWLMNKTKVFGYIFSGMWYDIGDFKALEEADRTFLQ